MRFRPVLVPLAFVALVLDQCRESDAPAIAPRQDTPRSEFVDGAHNNGNPHFFFLPPLVASPGATGTFDATQSPTVVVCQLSGSDCATIIAQFSTTTGTGSQVVRVDPADQLYIVNWETDQCVSGPCTLPAGNEYRIRVLVSGTELGHADVQVEASQRQAKNVNTGEFFALVDGRTLPIKMRIEVGAVFVAGPSTQAQTIQTPVTPSGSSVQLVLPAGALSQPTGVTVLPAAPPPGTSLTTIVDGTIYEFGPAGTTFAVPATITIHFAPAAIPSGESEATLRLFTLVNGLWQLVPGSGVNTATHAVTGMTGHFSLYGVGASRSVSAGEGSSCGLGISGIAVCWGRNDSGQLGNGTSISSTTPVAVSGGIVFQSVSAGGGYSCGVDSLGAGHCWGENPEGQLGDGSTTSRTSPVAVVGGLVFQAVVPSPAALGNLTDSTATCGDSVMSFAVYCWGGNVLGQLGNGAAVPPLFTPTPQAVVGVHNLTGLSGGPFHVCGVTSAGAAYCWGEGFLGNGVPTLSSTPVAVAGGLLFAQVSSGGDDGCGVPFAPLDSVFCWGDNAFGQLGNGTTTPSGTPVPTVPAGGVFVAVTAAVRHTCALSTTGSVYCWGDNTFGQLGNGTTTSSTTPVLVSGGLTFTSVSAGVTHTCAVTAPLPGTAYCWGDNTFGQLGNGTTTSSTVPVAVSNFP